MNETARYTSDDGHPDLRRLENGRKVRHTFTRGNYAGEEAEGEVKDGHIVYRGEQYSPTGAARAALREIRGESYEENGWQWWKYYDSSDDTWKVLENLREQD